MKSIKLERLGTPPDVIDYAVVLREVLRRPLNPQQGADITEMRQSLRVLDVLDKANGKLDLEDADYEHLKSKLGAMPWNVVDRRIVQLVDDVNAAQ
jgi:hypothetical protein